MIKRKFKELLTRKQKKEMEKLIEELTKEAKLVIEDYEENPSENSGSITQVHENSPFLANKEKVSYIIRNDSPL